MNILGMTRLGLTGGGGGGGGGGALTVAIVTLNAVGEAAYSVTNAHTKVLVSTQFVDDTIALSTIERFNNMDTSAIYIRSTQGAVDAGEQVVIAFQ